MRTYEIHSRQIRPRSSEDLIHRCKTMSLAAPEATKGSTKRSWYFLLAIGFILLVSIIAGVFIGLAVMDKLPSWFPFPSTSSDASKGQQHQQTNLTGTNIPNTPIDQSTNPTQSDQPSTSIIDEDNDKSGNGGQDESVDKSATQRNSTVSKEASVTEAMQMLSSNPSAKISFSREISMPDIIQEFQRNVHNVDRLKTFLVLARKLSHHLFQNDKNKRRSSSVDSLAKLASILILHKELAITQPILPLKNLFEGEGLYVDPTVLSNIPSMKGDEGSRFVKALRLYVLVLNMEAANVPEQNSLVLKSIIKDINEYISKNYEVPT